MIRSPFGVRSPHLAQRFTHRVASRPQMRVVFVRKRKWSQVRLSLKKSITSSFDRRRGPALVVTRDLAPIAVNVGASRRRLASAKVAVVWQGPNLARVQIKAADTT